MRLLKNLQPLSLSVVPDPYRAPSTALRNLLVVFVCLVSCLSFRLLVFVFRLFVCFVSVSGLYVSLSLVYLSVCLFACLVKLLFSVFNSAWREYVRG